MGRGFYRRTESIDLQESDPRSAVLRRYRWDAKDHCGATGKCCRNLQRFVLQVFDSKELLFFAMLEDIHTECFAAAQNALQENAALLPADRAAAAILAACRWLSEAKAFVFIENDAEFLLHRLPEEVKTAHYHDDETHIRTLLEAGGLQPKGGMALAAATVRGLILTVSHQGQIGALYPQVLETLVRGACRELFA